VLALAEHDLTTAHLVLRRITGRVVAYPEGREFAACLGVNGWATCAHARTGSVAVLLFEGAIDWTRQRYTWPGRCGWKDDGRR